MRASKASRGVCRPMARWGRTLLSLSMFVQPLRWRVALTITASFPKPGANSGLDSFRSRPTTLAFATDDR